MISREAIPIVSNHRILLAKPSPCQYHYATEYDNERTKFRYCLRESEVRRIPGWEHIQCLSWAGLPDYKHHLEDLKMSKASRDRMGCKRGSHESLGNIETVRRSRSRAIIAVLALTFFEIAIRRIPCETGALFHRGY